MRLSYPGDARLLHRWEFKRVYQEGQAIHHGLFVLYHCPSAQGPMASTRFGVTVSRQVSRRSVERNRIRRVLREAARHARPRFAPGHDIVLNARRAAAKGLGTPRILSDLLDLADRAGLLSEQTRP